MDLNEGAFLVGVSKGKGVVDAVAGEALGWSLTGRRRMRNATGRRQKHERGESTRPNSQSFVSPTYLKNMLVLKLGQVKISGPELQALYPRQALGPSQAPRRDPESKL